MNIKKILSYSKSKIKYIFRNKLLMLIIITTSIFILYLIWAYYPLIEFKLSSDDLSKQIPLSELTIIKNNRPISYKPAIPHKNMLIIPKIGVHAEIIEGASLNILDHKEGVWREPHTSQPLRGSNMVIAGHRWQFLPPNTNTFYLLPQLKINDSILIHWEGREYKYKITKSFETNVTNSQVFEDTKKTTITLYTCSPLSTATRRWVIRGEEII